MRFEVKGGGIAAILLAMTLLSGAVFVMGLLAGYEVGRQAQIDAVQLATSYPLQSPPPTAATSNQSAAASGNPSAHSAAPTPASPTAGGPVTAASAGEHALGGDSTTGKPVPSQPGATQVRQRLASASTPSAPQPAATEGSSAADEDSADEDSDVTNAEKSEASNESSEASNETSTQAGPRVAPKAASIHRRPYNIQIQAAMDITGADKMMARLQKLGYLSHLVPTEIAGQRWYKVEVGPYATAEEASNAEAELRQKYDATYGGVARDNSANQANDDDSDE
jgi:cell division protein FtsN